VKSEKILPSIDRGSILVLLLLLLGFMLGCRSAGAPEHAQPQPLLWRISHPSQASHLFLLGSMHVGKAPIESLDPVIEAAFADADGLVVEVHQAPGEELELQRAILARARLPAGTRLSDVVSEGVYARLRGALEELSLPPAMFDEFRPWFAYLGLVAQATANQGYVQRYGVDEYFIRRAEGRRPIHALESVNYQVAIFANRSPEVQEVLLDQTLERLDEIPMVLDEMVRAWYAGDADALAALILEDFAGDERLEPLYRDLYVERNRSMAKALGRRLESGGRWFTVVGAGHLVGEEGLPNLLRSRGYTVVRESGASADVRR